MMVEEADGSAVAVVVVAVSLPVCPVLDFSSPPLQEDKKNNTAVKKDTGRNRDDIIFLVLKVKKIRE